MDTTAHKVSVLEKVYYGLGDTASNLYFQVFINFLLFYYTDIFGIAPAAVGTMFLVTRIWDAFNDPLMGIISDRTKTKWGRFRPYLVWGALPIALIGVATFTTPDLGPDGKLVYAYITYTLMMMAYTFINIPYSALMGVLTPNSLERTSISSYRFFLAFIGALFVGKYTLELVDFFGGGDQALGFQLTMVLYGVLGIIMFLLTFKGTTERVAPSDTQSSSLKDDLTDLMSNGPWKALAFMGVCTLSYVVIRMGTVVYYFKYYVGSEELVGDFLFWGTLAVMAGLLPTKYLSKVLGKRKFYLIVMTLSLVLTAVFYFIPNDQIELIFALHIIISFVMAPQAPLVWAMFADAADYSEWKNGRRATGLVFSAATFAQKMGVAIGGALSGWILAYYGFEPNVEQTTEALNGIRLLVSVFPAVAGAGAVIAAIFYTLDDDLMAKIETELEARRAEQG